MNLNGSSGSSFYPLDANPTKWSKTLKQFVHSNELFEFDYFVGLTLKGLKKNRMESLINPCRTNAPLLTNDLSSFPLKATKNLSFSVFFRGYQMGPLAINGLISIMSGILELSFTHYPDQETCLN